MGPASAGHDRPPEGGPTKGVVVFAVGNRSRGDDALGPLLADRLAESVAREGRSARIELIEDFQLQIEHALDLEGRSLVLFVDAGTGTRAPCELRAVAPSIPGRAHTTHALAPADVLGVYRQVTGAEPPPSFILCVRGERFGLGEPLSAMAQQHLEAAWRALVALLERPDAATWRAESARLAVGPPPPIRPPASGGARVSAAPRRSARRAPGSRPARA